METGVRVTDVLVEGIPYADDIGVCANVEAPVCGRVIAHKESIAGANVTAFGGEGVEVL